MSKIETHPFETFIPENAKVLIIGSFPGRDVTLADNKNEHWFYSAKRNQFWKIISEVYNTPLSTKADKQNLFRRAGISITDIFLEISRKNNSNLDQNLLIHKYNDAAIREVIQNPEIESIYFTSRFVEKHFYMKFPEIKIAEYLPSPSPRYAKMTMEDKIKFYKEKLPEL